MLLRRSNEIGLSAIRYAGYWARNGRDLNVDELNKLDSSFTESFPKIRDGLNVGAMATAFQKVRATNDALVELFDRYDVLAMPAFGESLVLFCGALACSASVNLRGVLLNDNDMYGNSMCAHQPRKLFQWKAQLSIRAATCCR